MGVMVERTAQVVPAALHEETNRLDACALSSDHARWTNGLGVAA